MALYSAKISVYNENITSCDFASEAAAPAASQGLVQVVSESHDDAAILCELLNRSGYRSVWQKSQAVLLNAPSSKALGSGNYAATVLCYRSSKADDFWQIWDRLPLGKRVVVMSDCDSEQTVVSLLEAGAHHVFDINEKSSVQQVRLEAALRQHSRLANKSFTVDDIHFDVPKRKVQRGGKQIDLSPKEYDLAYYLFSNRDRIVGNSELMTSIWSLPPGMDTRRIDTAACRLRKKLGLNAGHSWELKRLRCVGYQLVPLELENGPADSVFSQHLQAANA